MRVKTIGIVLETREDAAAEKSVNIYDCYHWREPEEIKAIEAVIRELGFNTVILGTPAKFSSNLHDTGSKVDFIFNLSVGFKKRFRLALGPSLYELAGLCYSGADPYTKMVSQNKHLMKAFLDKLNIPTPEWTYVDRYSAVEKLEFPDFPLIVKPACEGSSIGIDEDSVVCSREELLSRIGRLLDKLDMPVIVERFIAGRELKVGIIGNRDIRFTGMIEDICDSGEMAGDRFIYFNAKTYGGFKKKKCDINCDISEKIVADCMKIYNMFLPVDYGTFDIRVDEKGRHYFLEFNADATLHPARTLAQCCGLNGLQYNDMIRMILEASFERWGIA